MIEAEPRAFAAAAGRVARGFTLIEILVALAILAVALAAAVRAASAATDGAMDTKERLLATWVAQNRLTDQSVRNAWPEPGVREGTAEQAGITFTWRETVSTTPNPRFRRVAVRVLDPHRTDHALVELVGFATRRE